MSQIQMKFNPADKQFYDATGRLIENYTLSINRITEILHCSRAYVHHNVQPHVRFVRIPVQQDTAPIKDKSDFDKMEQEYIRNCFLAQEGVISDDWKSTVWFNEDDFISWFNSHFAAYRRTQPADLNSLFPKDTQKAQELLNKIISFDGAKEHQKQYHQWLNDLEQLAKDSGTHNLYMQTVIGNPKNVITDKTGKVPFVAIDRPIKSIREMDFKVVKDFGYPSKATRYFEEQGAICYRTSGKALYMVPEVTSAEKLLMSPSKVWKERR